MSKEWMIVTFETEYDALQFADLCKPAKIEGRLMPIPRKLSAGCGIAWRSEVLLEQQIQELVQRHAAVLSCEVVKISL
ncbi:DUF3343 domain-containing protein [Enterococcus sp. DIV0756]|uniref:DUF3343 domain-containing protein n=1 Tax=Enterococcus sp. DIV0756 TaxID=2774636 RepID=UPI003F25A4D5